jgi:hypothetical protein
MPLSLSEPQRRSTPQPQTSSSRVRRPRTWRFWLGVAGAVAVAAALGAAVLQSPYPDPYRLPAVASPRWFLYPLEWNAPLRLPRIETHLRGAVFRETPKGEEMWVVGDDRFVARSDDRGATWHQMPIPERPGTGPEPAAASAGVKANPSSARDDARSVRLPPRNFHDVTSAAGHVWAVGEAGAILHLGPAETSFSWQDAPAQESLHAVRFTDDGARGVAVGDGGVVLSTRDGGKTWRRVWVRGPRPPGKTTVQGLDSDEPEMGRLEIGWIGLARRGDQFVAVGGDYLVSMISPERAEPAEDSSLQVPVPSELRPLFNDLTTRPVPPSAAGLAGRLSQVAKASPAQDSAVPSTMTNLLGDFDAIVPPPHVELSGVTPASDGRFWFIERFFLVSGDVLPGPDGRMTLSLSPDLFGPDDARVAQPSSVVVGKSGEAWLIDATDRVFATRDGGKTWPTSVSLVDGRYWYAPSLNSRDTQTALPPGIYLYHWWHPVLALDLSGRSGMAVGLHGFINRYDAATSTWVPVTRFLPRGRGRWVNGSLEVPSSTRAYASVDTAPFYDSLFLERPDEVLVGLDRWSLPGLTYIRLPAPWAWGALIVYALGFVAVRTWWPTPLPSLEGIASVLASDRPIGLRDPDALGFRQIAQGLSRFLRNEYTEPPLTVAITGEWGAGKSSLMQILRDDLKRRGFRPVWFNAWHHQQEEHLLASLLATVRSEAIPTLARLDLWVNFYSRLVFRRFRRRVIPIVAVLSVFCFSLGYVIQYPQALAKFSEGAAALNKRVQARLGLSSSKGEHAGNEEETKGSKTDGPALPVADGTNRSNVQRASKERDPVQEQVKTSSPYLLILSALGLLVSLWRGATAFGIKPGDMLASAASSVRVRDLSAQAGFRYQFCREFADVTWALHPRTLVLLVDDLDRCHPDNLMKVLETVNFLVSSGKCVVVLGMAKERVIGCIAHAFKDVSTGEAAPAVPGGDVPLGEDAAADRTVKFARNYLEKIINIELPVPPPTNDQARRLLIPDGAPDEGGQAAQIAPGPAMTARAPEIPLSPMLVPEVTPAPSAPVPDATDAPASSGPFTRGLTRLPDIARSYLPVAFAIAFVVGAFLYGNRLALTTRQNEERIRTQTGTPTASSAPPAPTVPGPGWNQDELPFPPFVPLSGDRSVPLPAAVPSADVANLARSISRTRTALDPPATPRFEIPLSLAVTLLVQGLAALLAVWLAGPGVVVRDSPAFTRALRLWTPLILARGYTPRALKRFLNHVRFAEERLGGTKDELTRWELFRAWLDGKLAGLRRAATPFAPAAAAGDGSREAMVVALCAIERFDPNLLTNDALWRQLIDGQVPVRGPNNPGVAAQHEAIAVEDALRAHRATFPGAWPPTDGDRNRFLEFIRQS